MVLHDYYKNDSFPAVKITDQLYLRRPIVNDCEARAIFNIYHDPLISKYIPDDCIPHNLDDVKRTLTYFNNLYENNNGIVWIIADIKSNEAIGAIGYQVWDKYHSRAEISYELNSKYWRRGITKKALLYAIKYAFEIMGVQRIQATTITNNNPSMQLLLKTGFTKEGILASYKFYKNNFVDIVMFGYSRLQYMEKKMRQKMSDYISTKNQKSSTEPQYTLYDFAEIHNTNPKNLYGGN